MRYFYYLVLIVFCLSQKVSSAEEKIVELATLGDYAPFCIAEDGAKSHQIIPVGSDAIGFTGYSWDIVRDSFHAMGYTVHLSIMPWPRAMSDVKKQRVDLLFPTGINSKRKKIFNYSKASINNASFIIYTLNDNLLNATDLTSLKGRVIGAKRDFNYGDKWASSTDIIKYNVKTIGQGFNMLLAKRIEGFIGYEYNWDNYVAKNNLKGKVKKLAIFGASTEHLVTLKANAEGNKALAVFDQGYNIINKQGKLNEIHKKWFN